MPVFSINSGDIDYSAIFSLMFQNLPFKLTVKF